MFWLTTENVWDFLLNSPSFLCRSRVLAMSFLLSYRYTTFATRISLADDDCSPFITSFYASLWNCFQNLLFVVFLRQFLFVSVSLLQFLHRHFIAFYVFCILVAVALLLYLCIFLFLAAFLKSPHHNATLLGHFLALHALDHVRSAVRSTPCSLTGPYMGAPFCTTCSLFLDVFQLSTRPNSLSTASELPGAGGSLRWHEPYHSQCHLCLSIHLIPGWLIIWQGYLTPRNFETTPFFV